MSVLKNKNIVVCVSGGIAAYKACDLVRKLVLQDVNVNVVMTKNACEFITPLTFQTLSHNKVSVDLFDLERESEIGHIALADNADLIVVAPATSTVLGKVSSGISDNLLTAVIMASRCPVVFCPSMNVNMYNNPIVQENINKLSRVGYKIIQPAEGSLACGWEGKGRLPDTEIIMQEIEKELSPDDLAGEKVLVTAGPTREHIDPVRFISNPSSGKMGFSIAKSAWKRKADVVLISGKTNEKVHHGIKTIFIDNVDQMNSEVKKYFDWSSIIIKSSAVGDYQPVSFSKDKLKKTNGNLKLELKKTKDILFELGKEKDGKILVGFAAETSDLIENAKAKLKEKNLDMIVVNDINKKGAGFEVDTNSAILIDRLGKSEELEVMLKEQMADKIFDNILELKSKIFC